MIIERNAIRAIILTPQHEVLLIRLCLPSVDDYFWITPGGGLKAGETLEEGLNRELYEELGLTQFVIGPLVWRRQHTFTWYDDGTSIGGKRICQREQYHVVHTDRFEPIISDPIEAKVIDQFRWWPVSELANAQERLTPLSLAQIVTRYMETGPPEGPLELEVLLD